MTNPFVRGTFGALYADDAVADLFAAPAVTARMLRVEAAWTRALAQVGAVTAEDAEAALAAIADCGVTDFRPGSAADGVPVPMLVRVLREGLDAGPAAAVHTGLTSQDVVDTAMVLTLSEVEALISERLSAVIAAVADLTDRFGAAPLVARTRMQAALPATASLRLGAWQRALEGHQAGAATLRAEVFKVQIGGAIGLRAAPEGHAEAAASRVAEDLGLAPAPVWHTDRSGPVTFGHWLTLLCGTLGKIGQDVALMAQQGVDEIALSGGGGSSAMPHKQNPVAAEAMVTLARFVAGQQGVLAQAMVHEQERSGAAWALEWLTLPPMAEATGTALTHAAALLGQVTRIGAA